MIDTHTHLYLPEFDDAVQPGEMGGQQAAVERAIKAGVKHMIFPNVDRSTMAPMRRLASLKPHATSMAMGLHPTEIKENWKDELNFIITDLRNNIADYVAVGEVGIDLYWDKTFEAEQMKAFDMQVAEAVKLNLPVIIHCREGLDQCLEVLKGYPGVRAVFHSFGGSVEDVDKIRGVGDFYFGINGIVTFKNSTLREVLPAIGVQRILTETDAPYLAPVPFRGKRNESAMMGKTLEEIARAFKLTPGETEEITEQNAKQLFDKLHK